MKTPFIVIAIALSQVACVAPRGATVLYAPSTIQTMRIAGPNVLIKGPRGDAVCAFVSIVYGSDNNNNGIATELVIGKIKAEGVTAYIVWPEQRENGCIILFPRQKDAAKCFQMLLDTEGLRSLPYCRFDQLQ